jgi:small-conductance mechanosensitive channel
MRSSNTKKWGLSTKLLIGVALIGAVHIVASLISRLVTFVVNSRNDSGDKKNKPLVHFVIGDVVYWTLLASALFILPTFGGFQTSSLVAILVSVMFAVGLGLQSILADLAAGIMLLLADAFEIGDTIQLPQQQITGTVVSFGILHTVLQTKNQVQKPTLTMVPNRMVYQSIIVL